MEGRANIRKVAFGSSILHALKYENDIMIGVYVFLSDNVSLNTFSSNDRKPVC